MAAPTSAPDRASLEVIHWLRAVTCAPGFTSRAFPVQLPAGQALGLRRGPVLLQKWDEMLKDGFMETGDVMEQRGPNTVVWIDRKKNIMKLSQVSILLSLESITHMAANAASTHLGGISF